MPININWKEMIRNMGKQYREGKIVCRDLSDGTKVCVSEKAWNVFFATGNKLYGKGFEVKEKPKKVEETISEEILKWYIGRK